MKQINLFAEETQLERLSKLGDSLERLKIIDFESFRPILNDGLKKERKSNAGRRSFDHVMMFKVLILEKLFNLSDDQTEYQITDRMSFQRFLGLSLGDKVPDAKTIWLFKNTLTELGIVDILFAQFNRMLKNAESLPIRGRLLTLLLLMRFAKEIVVMKTRRLRYGEISEEWEKMPHKKHQKDSDARWTKKGNETHYGYKDHVKVDVDSKLILDYVVTPANVHDSNEFETFFNKKDKVGYVDSAYTGKKLPNHVRNEICEKGYLNTPLTEEQKENNRRKSKIRCRIEHVFAFITMSMRGLTVRSIGSERAAFNIGLTNLVYNLCRYSFLSRKEATTG